MSAVPQDVAPQAITHPRLRILQAYVSQHLSEPLALGEAARLVGLSRNYFCEVFHKETGMCFSEWLEHYRIERAKSLLADARARIGLVAYAVGYHDLTTFGRAFKRHEGVTARHFQKALWAARARATGACRTNAE
jgi:AraC-like DNA-binding protein